MSPIKASPTEIVAQHWEGDAPDWIWGLAQQCEKASQNKVATALGCSASKISQILRNKYPAPLEAMADRYRGVFEQKTVACPALGDLQIQHCQDWRVKARELVTSNTRRVMMVRACNRCPMMKEQDE